MSSSAAAINISATSQSSECVPNIGPYEQRKRLALGIALLAAGVLAATSLVRSGVDLRWRLGLFLPFCGGMLSIFQVREQTCVHLAARGIRNLNGAEEAVPDDQRHQIRRQAARVYLRSALGAAMLTGLSLLLDRIPRTRVAPR